MIRRWFCRESYSTAKSLTFWLGEWQLVLSRLLGALLGERPLEIPLPHRRQRQPFFGQLREHEARSLRHQLLYLHMLDSFTGKGFGAGGGAI
jgi:hypothetical protein